MAASRQTLWQDIKSRILKCEIIPGFFSNHSDVVTDLDITDASRGKGFWKLNCSLLNEEQFCSIIRHCIRETQVNNKGCNPHTMWEVIKCRIRGVSIKYSGAKKRAHIDRLSGINKRLLDLEQMVLQLKGQNYPNIINYLENELEEIKAERFKFIDQETTGHMIRSRTQYYEHGEKSSKYFLSL